MAKIRIKKEEIGPGDEKPTAPSNLTQNALTSQKTEGKIADQFNIRDALAGFIGTGAKDFSNDQRLKDFRYIQSVLGSDQARKLMTHVFVFNSRPDMQGKTPDQRLQAFYDIGSNDPAVNQMLQGYKNLAQGPLSGMRESGDMTNQALTGRLPIASLAVK